MPQELHERPDVTDKPKVEWAGKGHELGCLLQTGALVVVNLLVWGFIYIWALKQSHVQIRDAVSWWPF